MYRWFKSIRNKHKALNQCWFIADPPYAALVQHPVSAGYELSHSLALQKSHIFFLNEVVPRVNMSTCPRSNLVVCLFFRLIQLIHANQLISRMACLTQPLSYWAGYAAITRERNNYPILTFGHSFDITSENQ